MAADNVLFIAIKLSDNDFSSLLEQTCQILIQFISSLGESFKSVDYDQLRKLIADSVARMSVISDGCYTKFYKSSDNTSGESISFDYDSEFNRLHDYIYNNLELAVGIDEVINVLLSNTSNKKDSLREFGLDDKFNLHNYLFFNKDNYALIPCLFWDNAECIILRVVIENNSSIKSQLCLI